MFYLYSPHSYQKNESRVVQFSIIHMTYLINIFPRITKLHLLFFAIVLSVSLTSCTNTKKHSKELNTTTKTTHENRENTLADQVVHTSSQETQESSQKQDSEKKHLKLLDLYCIVASKASLKDRTIVGKWLKEEFGHSQPYRTPSEWVHIDKNVPLITYFIYNQEKQVVGTFCFQKDNTSARKLWLANVVVDPSRRNQGIGRKLNAFAVKEAKKSKANYLYLHALEAIGFWKKMGWTIIGSEPHCNDIVAIMRIELE